MVLALEFWTPPFHFSMNASANLHVFLAKLGGPHNSASSLTWRPRELRRPPDGSEEGLKSFQNDPKVTPIDTKVIPNDPKVIPKSSQSDPKVATSSGCHELRLPRAQVATSSGCHALRLPRAQVATNSSCHELFIDFHRFFIDFSLIFHWFSWIFRWFSIKSLLNPYGWSPIKALLSLLSMRGGRAGAATALQAPRGCQKECCKAPRKGFFLFPA